MTRRVLLRCLLLAVTGCAALAATVASLALRSPAAQVSTAASTVPFNPGNIIADSVFFAGQAMSAGEVDSFIAVKGASCVPGSDGTPCLKDLRLTTSPRAADAYCAGYQAGTGETAGAVIAQVARACGISPKVLLVVLQKEQGLLTDSGRTLYATRYQKAMGFACPDTAACDTSYYGFQNQLYAAARQFKLYGANPTRYNYRAGVTRTVYYSPDPSCGSSAVTIADQATAALYNYTPYQPNAAALAAGYGTGDGCSSYGNRNFWLYFTDWFGSTQYDAAAVSLPKGSLDAVTSSYGQITAAGWAFDPDGPAQPIAVHVYLDGAPLLATAATLSRPDVSAAYPAAGPLHGYSATFPATLGTHQVCTYAINVAAGQVNPQLGCATVVNQDPGAPRGSLDAASSPGPDVVAVTGWAVDGDATAATVPVHIYVDDQLATVLTADGSRPDLVQALGTGPAHGFTGQVAASPGTHAVCAFGINVGLGVTNTRLGCATVTVRAPADYDPVSALDELSAAGGTVTVAGWSYDGDTPGQPVAVHLYVDGTLHVAVGTGLPRGDVAQVHPDAGPAAGFRWSGVLPAGLHQVCAFAINTGYGDGNPVIGCRQVRTVAGTAADPVGSFDAAAGGPGALTVSGWADDPDAPDAPAAVHVYVDGSFATALSAAVRRPDVGAALGPSVGPDHGWTWTGTPPTGRHQVCVYVINVGAGTGNPGLGCRTVTVLDPAAAHDPVGSLDAVRASGTTISVLGWALDPDLGTAPATVHLYVDGSVLTGLAAGAPRPDVGAVYPASGSAHGFSWSGSLAAGRHTVCAYAINSGTGTGVNPSLGCRTVTAG